LLDPASPACSIREDIKRGVYVDGITEELVSSPEDAYRVRLGLLFNEIINHLAFEPGCSESACGLDIDES
jgi:hypothetical protein